MVFVARLLQEKCREQHSSLYLAFIDPTMAFNTVSRTLLCGILSKFCCTSQFLAVFHELRDGMSTRVVLSGLESVTGPNGLWSEGLWVQSQSKGSLVQKCTAELETSKF